jgi:hypothetical protein
VVLHVCKREDDFVEVRRGRGIIELEVCPVWALAKEAVGAIV